MFEVVFDYGEHDRNRCQPTRRRCRQSWPRPPGSFSTYRAGFEVRTYRLCQRVLMFHHFPDEAGIGDDCLVRSTDFTYTDEQDPRDARNPRSTPIRLRDAAGYQRDGGGYR